MKVRGTIRIRIALDALVQRENVQHLQVLALVLMQPLHQHIEHRFRIDGDPQPVVNVGRSCSLVVALDGSPFLVQLSASSTSGSSRRSFSSRDPAEPSRAVSSSARRGLLSTIQRRGVTPLVLLENFSGVSS
jgi:hypothetical protein